MNKTYEQILDVAQDKFNNPTMLDYTIPLDVFAAECYIGLTPSAYGSALENYFINSLKMLPIPSNKGRGDALVDGIYMEIKVSFLTKKRRFCITHIRQWQEIDYYLICFIDCEERFRPYIYLIDKSCVEKLKLTAMNGTKESNKNNDKIEQRVTIDKNSLGHNIIKEDNKLNGTSIEDLIDFFKKK